MAYIKLEDLQKFPIRKNHCDKEHGNEHFIYGIETVLEYAEYLPTYDIVPNLEWVPVHERCPDHENTVLVIDCDRLISTGYYNGQWHSMLEERFITHWMELPEPPKILERIH
jgi:hypothetical protein